MELEATHLRDRKYAVRPKGRLGTCGFYPRAWTAFFTTANSPAHAIEKAIRKGHFG